MSVIFLKIHILFNRADDYILYAVFFVSVSDCYMHTRIHTYMHICIYLYLYYA